MADMKEMGVTFNKDHRNNMRVLTLLLGQGWHPDDGIPPVHHDCESIPAGLRKAYGRILDDCFKHLEDPYEVALEVHYEQGWLARPEEDEQ